MTGIYCLLSVMLIIKEKRLLIEICKTGEMKSNKEVYSTEWCKSELQLADCLTKGTVNCKILLKVLRSGSYLLK